MADPVTDLRDIRVMIPRVRRAIDGPTAMGSAAISTSLTDEELTAAIADAVAEIIFFSGGQFFGAELEVVERDAYYQAPTAWRTSIALTEPQQTVVTAQAAINFHFRRLSDQSTGKTQETIRDEGGEWSWSISANILRDWLKMLMDARDRALAQVEADAGASFESYESYLHVRDAQVAAFIEPWVTNGGARGGMELVDVRSGWLPE